MFPITCQSGASTRAAITPLAPVHGDTKMRNYFWRKDKLVGVLDWEMAHVGEPLVALGCHLYRTGRATDPRFSDWGALLPAYCELAGWQ